MPPFSAQRETKLQEWGKVMMRGPLFLLQLWDVIDRQSEKRTHGEVKAEDCSWQRSITSWGGCREKSIRLFLALSSESCLNRALVSRLPLRITSSITAVCLILSLSPTWPIPPPSPPSSPYSSSISSSLCVGTSLSVSTSFQSAR